jgi:hypothetical protein
MLRGVAGCSFADIIITNEKHTGHENNRIHIYNQAMAVVGEQDK